MRLFHSKKVVDEREQMEMFRIEHYMYWFAFWALLIAIFVQTIFMEASFGQVAGEWVVFMLMAIGLLIGDMKGGHFDYNSRPDRKYYLIYALAAAVAVIALTFVRGMWQGWYTDLTGIVSSLFLLGSSTFLLTFIALAAAGTFVKYRRRKLEEEYDEE